MEGGGGGTVISGEERSVRVGALLAGLYELAVEAGFRFEDGRWVEPNVSELRAGLGQETGCDSDPRPRPLVTETGLAPVLRGAPKRAVGGSVLTTLRVCTTRTSP